MAKIRNFEDAQKKNKKKPTKQNRSLTVAIIFAMAVGFTILIVLQTTSILAMFRADKEARKQPSGFPVAIEDDQELGIYSADGKIIILTETHIFIYDSQGHLYLSVLHGMSNPVCEIVGTNILYYGRQGKTARVISFYGEEIATYSVDGEIVSAALSKNGYVAIAYKSTKGISKVDIHYGNQTMEWKDSESFVFMVRFSSDNQSILIGTYNADESGQLISTIKEYTKLTSEPRNVWTLSGALVIDLHYLDGNPIVIADEKILALKSGGTTEEYSYGGKTLISYHFYKSGLVLEFSQFTAFDARQVLLLTKELEEKATYSTEAEVTAYYLDSGTFYILSEGILQWYTKDGEEVAELAVPKDAVGMVVIGRDAYIVSATELNCFPLSGSTAPSREASAEMPSYESLELTSDAVSSEATPPEETSNATEGNTTGSTAQESEGVEAASSKNIASEETSSAQSTLGGNPQS